MVTPATNFRGRRVLVIGLGLHGGGVAAARWLVKHGARVTVTDVKTADQLAPSLAALRGLRITYVLGRHRLSDVRAADHIIQNPGVPNDAPQIRLARQLKKPIDNEATLFFSHCPAPIIGITGTRGKSTTADLTAALLRGGRRRVWLGGNIRIPMLNFVDQIKSHDIVVLELSSWQLEAVAAHRQHPQVAVVTNLYPDHLNRYGSMAAYAKAKEGMLRWQTSDEVAILNAQNRYTAAMGRRAPGHVYWFGATMRARQDGVSIARGKIMLRKDGKATALAAIADIQLLGSHNRENVLAATLVASLQGIAASAIRRTLKAYRGLPDRLEIIGERAGITYINDTTATSPDGTAAALAAVAERWPGRRVVLIAGGADKNVPAAAYRTVRQKINRQCRAVVLFAGKGSAKFGTLSVPTVREVTTMVDAVGLARAFARSGDVILLSPGSASFGLFMHEFARGEEFRVASRQ